MNKTPSLGHDPVDSDEIVVFGAGNQAAAGRKREAAAKREAVNAKRRAKRSGAKAGAAAGVRRKKK